MGFKPHDIAVLVRDLPEHRLRAGDVGAVVFTYDARTFEVEFVLGSGGTQALVTLSSDDIRPMADADLLAVRTVEHTA
jgi:hypothetical protein